MSLREELKKNFQHQVNVDKNQLQPIVDLFLVMTFLSKTTKQAGLNAKEFHFSLGICFSSIHQPEVRHAAQTTGQMWGFTSFCTVHQSPYMVTQYSQQQSVPDLYVVTVAFLALKKGSPKKNWFFSLFRGQKFFFLNFFYKFLCNFSVRTLWCFQKKFKIFFGLEKVKKQASKVAHNRPRPFFPTNQPRPQPTAQN